MDTTIQVSRNLLETLAKMKMYDKESYEEVIWDLLEDRMQFSQETMANIESSKKEIKEGRTISLENLKKKLKF